MSARMTRTVDIELPLQHQIGQQIAAMRRDLARKRAERPAREGIRRMLAGVMADTTEPVLVIR